mgnify:CR=1 FL=1
MSQALEPFHLRHVGWLLGSLALVAAPHAERLPWWVTVLVTMLFAWRGYVALNGLALPRNTLSLYSTAPGRAALDGPAGQNSPFAAVLLRRLAGKSFDLAGLNPLVRRDLLIETEGRQLMWGDHTFSQKYEVRGPAAAKATVPPRVVPASRIVELKNAYAHAREIRSTLPGGIVSVRPPPGGPGEQFVGSFKFSGRGDVPFLLIVLSATDGRAAEIIVAWIDGGRPIWRYVSARLSGDTLEAQTWANGQRFALRWSGRDGGSATIFAPPTPPGPPRPSTRASRGWTGEGRGRRARVPLRSGPVDASGQAGRSCRSFSPGKGVEIQCSSSFILLTPRSSHS